MIGEEFTMEFEAGRPPGSVEGADQRIVVSLGTSPAFSTTGPHAAVISVGEEEIGRSRFYVREIPQEMTPPELLQCGRRARAVPDRRELACLPGLFRVAGVDRDERRAAHQCDLRAASMLVKIIAEHRPAGVVVAWDAGMSGREVVYDLYKAQRPPGPTCFRSSGPT